VPQTSRERRESGSHSQLDSDDPGELPCLSEQVPGLSRENASLGFPGNGDARPRRNKVRSKRSAKAIPAPVGQTRPSR
jgi:hypothetical protein